MRSGQKVGKYTLGERIARGGMAEVWAARVEGPEGFVKSVALKFVVDSGDPEMDRLFVNEARLAGQLQHPNLVTVFDFDRIVDATDFGSPGRYYIAMERVEGHDLRRVLEASRETGRRLGPTLALYVAAEVLQGLRYVHERPTSGSRRGPALVHRDVSPHNVLVAYTGDVKLSDFGIAKTVAPLVATTQPGLVRGKLSYAAPEQIRGGPVDHRADQFSLGVLLWEMLADARLFGGGSDVEIMGRVSSGEIPPLPRAAQIDRAIEAVVRRMLANDREQRFATTAAALAAVVALPGYVGDGTALGAWMGALFSPRDPALPSTQELPSPGLRAAPAVTGATLMLRERPAALSGGMAVPAAHSPRRPVERAGTEAMARSRPKALTPRRSLASFPVRPLVPVQGGRPALLRWGLVAMGIAVVAWGAAMAIRIGGSRRGDILASRASVRHPGAHIEPVVSPRMPILAEPVRSGEPAPVPRTAEDDGGASDGLPVQEPAADLAATILVTPDGERLPAAPAPLRMPSSSSSRMDNPNGAPIIE